MNIESLIIGQSSSMKQLRKEITNLAKRKSHILLSGPVGVGKTMIATAIHQTANAHGAFVRLNPHSTPEQEIKSALEKPGTRTSTFLIQEIEEFSFLHQAGIKKLIRLLGKRPAAKVIMTSKRDMSGLRRDEKILPELFEAIKDFEFLEIPPLHMRREDIPLLVEQFIRNSCESLGVAPKSIDINALDFLVRREWKENVRELKSVIEHGVLSSDGDTIELPKYLVDEIGQLEGMVANIREKRPFEFDKSLSNLEKTLIEKALEVTGFNQTKAAFMLNISDANLRYRLRKFKILPARQR